jgi:hypothetical protein
MNMEKEDYKKYIGKYIRNQFGIAKIVGLLEQNGILYLQVDKDIVYDSKTNKILGNVYPITEESNLENRIKDLIDLIKVGDIIKWEANDIGYYGVNEVIRRPETKKTLGVYPEEYDYLLPLERLKIIKVLTREQFEENSYEVQYG